MGGSSAPQTPDVGANLERSIGAYSKFGGDLLTSEQKYEPAYSKLQTQDNINSLTSLSNYYLGSQVPQEVNTAQGIQNKVLGQTTGQLSSTEAALRAASPDEQAASSVANKLALTGNDTSLTGIGDRLASNQRGADFTSLQSNVMGKLGTTDPLTQQLQDEASKEVALGGKLSDQETNAVAQQSRAADSSRGIFNSNASRSNELLNLDQYANARRVQRQTFASGVSQLADQQAQEKTANASALTSLDESLTNQNLTNAATVYGNADNLKLAAQQAGLTGLLSLSTNDTNNAMNLIGNASQTGNAYAGNMGSVEGYSGAGGPAIFNSLGLFGASNNNAQLGYQGQLQSYLTNQQNQQSMIGGGIAAGVSVAGSIGVALI